VRGWSPGHTEHRAALGGWKEGNGI
jgi:hypothetical protein